jgi:hypothetical protein
MMEIFNCLHKKVDDVLNICLDKLEMSKSKINKNPLHTKSKDGRGHPQEVQGRLKHENTSH